MPKPVSLGTFKSQRLRASEMSDLLARQNALQQAIAWGFFAALAVFTIAFFATRAGAMSLQLPV